MTTTAIAVLSAIVATVAAVNAPLSGFWWHALLWLGTATLMIELLPAPNDQEQQ